MTMDYKELIIKKLCSICKKYLLLGEFNIDRSRKDGLKYFCRGCESQQNRKRYIKNREEVLRQKKQYYRDNRDKCLRLNKKYRGTIRGHLCRVFHGMNQRCNSSDHPTFKNYGGRGIRNRFGSSAGFVEYVISTLQVDPRGLQIDRINNNGHYEKGNIRFVTCKENLNNRRNSK